MRRFTRKEVLSVLVGLLVGSGPVPSALATTWARVTKTCPVCGAKASASVPRSTFIPGMTDDFRPLGVGVDMTIRSLLMCPKCGFTAQYHRFDEAEGLNKHKVREALAAVKSTQLFLKLDRVAAVEKAWTASPPMLAKLALAAKWLADDTGEEAVIQQRLSAAIEAHKTAAAAKDLPAEQKVMCTYLIGELYRQGGKTKEAIEWLTKARKLGQQGDLAPLANKQLFCARYADKPIASVLAAAREGSNVDKLAALAFLRESADKAVIAFLKEFVLNCPEDLREAVMDALLYPEPQEHHLPIFLAGLKNRHFGIVHRSAWGVEALRAAQAAPIIVEALKNTPKDADYRLLAALAATATEKDLPALEKLMGSAGYQSLVFRALLNTRSKKAVPLIVKMLKKEPMYASYKPEEWAQNAAAFGQDLLKALPNLATADEDDPLAMFKIHVLGAIRTDTARKQLQAVLKRDDDLSLEAAIQLGAQGDTSGKAILLENVGRLRTAGRDSIAQLYPMLTQADFGPLHERMKKDLLQKEKDHKERKAHLEKQSRSVRKWEKEMAERELSRMRPFDADWIAYDWMPLLGATGNPKARPILMKYLDHPNPQYRAGAARALGSVYDKTVGDAFAQRLSTEQSWVRLEMILAIGRGGDTSRLSTLVAAVEQPTLVSTKLAWIQTMMKLHPKEARAILNKWAASRNGELSRAGRQALSKIQPARSR